MKSILKKFKSLFNKDIGIDLGTANCLVFVRDQGIVLNEPSVVAIHTKTGKAIAVGKEAQDMLGKTPGSIKAIRPMKDGVMNDVTSTQIMLKYFIQKVHKKGASISQPRVLIAVPSGISEVEENAVKESAQKAGAGEVELIFEPMAAAIGIGLPVSEPNGNMIVDIGGGTAEIAVISLADIVESVSVKVGGDTMDLQIMEYIKRKYNLAIGERAAEEIKIKIGSAYPFPDGEKSMDIKGRDLLSGLPKTINIKSDEIRTALSSSVKDIVDGVKTTLDKCPAPLAADLIDNGIFLAGGGALLQGLDKKLREETGLPVSVADDPLLAVAKGTGIALQQMDMLVKNSSAARRHTKRLF